MDNPVASYFSHLKKNMDSGALLFIFKDRAPIAIHKSFLFKKFDLENGDTRSLFSTFISSIKMDSPPLNVYYKNLEGKWVDVQKLGSLYSSMDPLANAEISGYADRFIVTRDNIPSTEYTDMEGFIHIINEHDGYEPVGANPIEIDESRELIISPFSMENPQLSWNEREMMRDISVTAIKDNYNENILVWLNGRFLAPTKDNTSVRRFYIRSGMDYVDSWSIDQKNNAPKLLKRASMSINKTGLVVSKFNIFNIKLDMIYESEYIYRYYARALTGDIRETPIISIDEENDKIAIALAPYLKVSGQTDSGDKVIIPNVIIKKISTNEILKNIPTPIAKNYLWYATDTNVNAHKSINGYKNFIYHAEDGIIYRMDMNDEEPSFKPFAGNNDEPFTSHYNDGDLALSKNIFMTVRVNTGEKYSYIGLSGSDESGRTNGVNFLAFEDGLYVIKSGVLGYIDHSGIYHFLHDARSSGVTYFYDKVFKINENVYYVVQQWKIYKLQIDTQSVTLIHDFNPTITDYEKFSIFGENAPMLNKENILNIDDTGILYIHWSDNFSNYLSYREKFSGKNYYIRKINWNGDVENVFGTQSNLTDERLQIGVFNDDKTQGLNLSVLTGDRGDCCLNLNPMCYYQNDKFYISDKVDTFSSGFFTVEYKEDYLYKIKYKPSTYVEENSDYDNVRFDQRLRLFKWNNVKINKWEQPALLKDYSVLLNEDDDYVNVYKEITFSEIIKPNAHLIINNGRILSENDYYIDPKNPKKIILKRIHFEAQDYYRDAKKYYSYYSADIKKDPRFLDPVDYVIARGSKYPALEATRTRFGYQSYSLVNFDSIDGRPIRLIRQRNARPCFPYHDEIAFDEIGINDIVIINGYFTPYEWKEDNVIKLPITKNIPLYRTISTLDKADVYRLKFIFN